MRKCPVFLFFVFALIGPRAAPNGYLWLCRLARALNISCDSTAFLNLEFLDSEVRLSAFNGFKLCAGRWIESRIYKKTRKICRGSC